MSLKMVSIEAQISAPDNDMQENLAQSVFTALEFLAKEARGAGLCLIADTLDEALGKALDAHVDGLRAALEARVYEAR